MDILGRIREVKLQKLHFIAEYCSDVQKV